MRQTASVEDIRQNSCFLSAYLWDVLLIMFVVDNYFDHEYTTVTAIWLHGDRLEEVILL